MSSTGEDISTPSLAEATPAYEGGVFLTMKEREERAKRFLQCALYEMKEKQKRLRQRFLTEFERSVRLGIEQRKKGGMGRFSSYHPSIRPKEGTPYGSKDVPDELRPIHDAIINRKLPNCPDGLYGFFPKMLKWGSWEVRSSPRVKDRLAWLIHRLCLDFVPGTHADFTTFLYQVTQVSRVRRTSSFVPYTEEPSRILDDGSWYARGGGSL